MKNPVTGNPVLNTAGVLLSVADKTLELNNDKRTKYRPCTVEIPTKLGRTKAVRAIMYEENFKHGVEIGDSLLVTVEDTGNPEPFITVSHLKSAQRASVSDFDWGAPATTPEAISIEDVVRS